MFFCKFGNDIKFNLFAMRKDSDIKASENSLGDFEK